MLPGLLAYYQPHRGEMAATSVHDSSASIQKQAFGFSTSAHMFHEEVHMVMLKAPEDWLRVAFHPLTTCWQHL